MNEADLRDLAGRPQAAMRGLRRRLTRALVSRITARHPDLIEFRRDDSGALHILAPVGWHVSVAGQWPHCVIGLSRHLIGVDVERRNADPPPNEVFTSSELIELSNMEPEDRLPSWLAKEAHAKAFLIATAVSLAEIITIRRSRLRTH